MRNRFAVAAASSSSVARRFAPVLPPPSPSAPRLFDHAASRSGDAARGELYAVHARVAHDIRERAFVARLAHDIRVRAGIAHRPRGDGGRFRLDRSSAPGPRWRRSRAHRDETQGFPRGFAVEFRRGRERPGDARVRAGGRPERRRLHHAHAPEEARRRATRARVESSSTPPSPFSSSPMCVSCVSRREKQRAPAWQVSRAASSASRGLRAAPLVLEVDSLKPDQPRTAASSPSASARLARALFTRES